MSLGQRRPFGSLLEYLGDKGLARQIWRKNRTTAWMQDDPMDGNVIKLKTWCGFPSGYVLAQPPTPTLSYINHFPVIYPQGRFALQIALAIFKRGWAR